MSLHSLGIKFLFSIAEKKLKFETFVYLCGYVQSASETDLISLNFDFDLIKEADP